jgi:hypothetical protein
VSGIAIYRSCFRIFTLSCCAWSALVRWCPSLSDAIVTHLVTRLGLVATARCLWFPLRSGTRRLSMRTIGNEVNEVVRASRQVKGDKLDR